MSFDVMLIFLMFLFRGPFTCGINFPKMIKTKAFCIEKLDFELFLLMLEFDWHKKQECKDS